MKTIEELRQRLAELQESAKSIQDTADAEKRDLNAEESQQLEAVFADFEAVEADIGRREKIAAQEARMTASAGRRTSPEPIRNAAKPKDDDDDDAATLRRVSSPLTPRHERERWGWKNFGDFACSVKNACVNGGSVDPRLQNAPTTYGSEGVGPDGGFAVPPDFRTNIMEKVSGEDSLLSLCDQVETSGNSITVPKDETTDWGTAGIQAYWDGEAAQYTQKKPALETSTIRTHKLTALVPVTDELLEDAPALGSYVQRKAPSRILYKVNDAILNGTGAGMPFGISGAACTVTVSKESSQAADTVKAQNIAKMWSRMPAAWRGSAVWLAHSDVEPQLMQMGFQVTDAANANPTGAIPLYVPPGGFSQSPFGTLLGRPIIPTQAAQALGDKGDITFAALSQYGAVLKTGGIRADSSIHLFFDYGLTAFRFTFRMGGQPWWSSTYAAGKGSTTYGPFINLEAR